MLGADNKEVINNGGRMNKTVKNLSKSKKSKNIKSENPTRIRVTRFLISKAKVVFTLFR